ncbi:hypothetical protein D1872_284380 [compost metagenome]
MRTARKEYGSWTKALAKWAAAKPAPERSSISLLPCLSASDPQNGAHKPLIRKLMEIDIPDQTSSPDCTPSSFCRNNGKKGTESVYAI